MKCYARNIYIENLHFERFKDIFPLDSDTYTLKRKKTQNLTSQRILHSQHEKWVNSKPCRTNLKFKEYFCFRQFICRDPFPCLLPKVHSSLEPSGSHLSSNPTSENILRVPLILQAGTLDSSNFLFNSHCSYLRAPDGKRNQRILTDHIET